MSSDPSAMSPGPDAMSPGPDAGSGPAAMSSDPEAMSSGRDAMGPGSDAGSGPAAMSSDPDAMSSGPHAMTADRAPELAEIVAGCAWLVGVLGAVRGSGLPDAWVGAGTLRDLVWGTRYGSGFRPEQVRDVDVAFFDPGDLSRQRDRAATDLLLSVRPDVPWEATNQAAVHTWYHETFRTDPVPPLISAADGIATWPETATSVAVRLTLDGRLEVSAPNGLDDLLDGIWRRNPRRASVQESRARLARHDPARRWPSVRVIAP